MDIRKVESVQRRFTKRLYGMKYLSYSERLAKLNLETLELRRVKFDLVYLFKIIHGLVGTDCNIFELSHSLVLRGHNCKFKKPVVNNNIRLHSYACRVVDSWNSLPQSAIDSTNVNVFISNINRFNFSKFLHVMD
jgi:hypothetical protein